MQLTLALTDSHHLLENVQVVVQIVLGRLYRLEYNYWCKFN